MIEVVSSFKYTGSCICEDRGMQEDVKITLGEGLKTLSLMNMMFNVRITNL